MKREKEKETIGRERGMEKIEIWNEGGGEKMDKKDWKKENGGEEQRKKNGGKRTR